MITGIRQQALANRKEPKLVAYALCAMLFALCVSAHAQQPTKVVRIGAFLPASASATAHMVEAFRQGLREHGYVGTKNVTLEPRYAEGNVERLAPIADELVRLKVDVIVVGSTPGAMAAKNATGAIPIVIVTTGDPVANGLIASLAHPGGNLTGVTALGQELSGKRLEMLKEAVPKVSRVAVLANPANPDTALRHPASRRPVTRRSGVPVVPSTRAWIDESDPN